MLLGNVIAFARISRKIIKFDLLISFPVQMQLPFAISDDGCASGRTTKSVEGFIGLTVSVVSLIEELETAPPEEDAISFWQSLSLPRW